MTKTLPITKAREELATIVDRANRYLDDYVITVNGVPAAILISPTEYGRLTETDEILQDKKLMKSLERAERDVKEGKVFDWEDVKKELKINVQN
ncbi:MAG TPA: type II toxin-antitoxin system Phd/YefM family antitoxin [Alphaproteobacteria bacterium]|jgi:prevent-host-death family protein|nr:type II toxin-antitoxin system Phd/YefM family antitoxin [Alphaproteobacteria bacterium]